MSFQSVYNTIGVSWGAGPPNDYLEVDIMICICRPSGQSMGDSRPRSLQQAMHCLSPVGLRSRAICSSLLGPTYPTLQYIYIFKNYIGYSL